jgi:branched-chain amino acid transport system ATP-binding protein
MNSEPILQVEHLRLTYGDIPAVWDISLTATPGRTTALIGRNGAGKSTTLLGICGLVRCRGGRVVLDGEDITGTAPWRRVTRGLSLVQEGRRIFGSLSVHENLVVGLRTGRDRGKSGRETISKLYERFPDLAKRREISASDLSGGQQQMLAIAQALASEPRVLMVDEPSSGLAPVIVDQVLDLLAELTKDGLAVVLVEQQLQSVLSGFADEVVAVDSGRVVFTDAAENVTIDRLAQEVLFAGSEAEPSRHGAPGNAGTQETNGNEAT